MSGDAERGLFWSTCAVRVACLVVCSLMHTRMISVDVLNGVKSIARQLFVWRFVFARRMAAVMSEPKTCWVL